MKKVYVILLIFITSALLLSTRPVAETIVEQIGTTLKKYTEEFPQEKIYLHTDRPYYLSGETIWLKAYVTAGTTQQLSTISNTVYVELLASDKSPVEKFILRADSGLGHGYLELPADLESGTYLLRAYTNWMRNFGEPFFFTKELKVWNLDLTEKKSTKKSDGLELQFFPEGGHLIEGLRNRVAFKAIGPDGLGREVSGKLVDDENNQVLDFKSTHLGMGDFFLSPEKGKRYRAIITSYPELSFPLESAKTGVALTVTYSEKSDDVVVKIQLSESLPRPQSFTLAVHQRGDPSFLAQFTLANVIYFVKIPKAKLAHGLNHLTLFNTNAKPLSERLLFIDKGEQLTINVSGLKESYRAREKVELEIETLNSDGKRVPAYLSLTAIHSSEVALDSYDKNILNYLLLSSDLKGHIEAPGFYFDSKNADRYAKLDLLLLTQGWSRFRWDSLLQDQWPALPHYVEKGLNIQGSLVDELTKKPVEGGKVTYFTSSNNSDILVAATGNKGRFIFDDVVFCDSSQAVLQGENRKGKNFVLFNVDPLWPQQTSTYSISEEVMSLNEFQRSLIAKGVERRKIDSSYQFEGKTIILDEVEIKEKRIEADQEKRMYMGASRTIRTENVLGSQYMLHPLELLRGTAGIRLTPNPPGYFVTIRGVGTIGSGAEPLILLDNTPVDINMLNTIPVSSISSVDIFRGAEAAAFGSQGANGVIIFYSKSGSGITQPPKGIFTFNFTGYQTPREFYSPKYDIQKPEHIKPDSRATVHWQPLIQTNAEGKATVSFYNPDPEGEIIIQLEGLSILGLPGVRTQNYQIQK